MSAGSYPDVLREFSVFVNHGKFMLNSIKPTATRRLLTLLLSVFILWTFSSCSLIKRFFPKKEVGISLGSVEELRLQYLNGDIDALEEIIAIYEDENQPLDVRVFAVRAIGESRHPLALESLSNYVREAEALDLDLMLVSVDVLGDFQDDPRASEALMESIFTIDEKLRGLQAVVFKSLANVRAEDQVLALLDIYEKSRAAYYNSALMVSKTLGKMNKDEVIPILVFISNDASLDIKIRNRAIDILAQKKDSPEVVAMFVEMLTDPSTEARIRDFAFRTMKDIKEERLILALLETYNLGQSSYFSLLNTLLDALGKFDDPAVKPTLVEMALSESIPQHLRIKAIKNLGNFKDPTLFAQIIPMLEEPDNYQYYPHIIDLAERLGVTEEYKDEIKAAALVAQEKALEQKKSEE